MSTQKVNSSKINLSGAAVEGLAVLATNGGSSEVGRFNNRNIGTIHHNSLKVLVAAGLATDVTNAKGARKIALTAAGKKEAKARGIVS